MKKPQHVCAACGWRHLEFPQRSASGGASHEICPACGFESGVTDDDLGFTVEDWRQRWAAAGLQWSSKGKPRPATWNPVAELRSLMRRKRPVIPIIRMRRAALLRGETPAEAAPPAKTKATRKRAALAI